MPDDGRGWEGLGSGSGSVPESELGLSAGVGVWAGAVGVKTGGSQVGGPELCV